MINGADTAWVLVCAALVLFMVPGLALFYGGMVSYRNVLVMLQQNIFPMGALTIVWIVLGYSLAFGPDSGAGVLGTLKLFGLSNLSEAPAPALHVIVSTVSIPTLAFVVYQMMFAIITPALITGATADRLKFGGYAIFIVVWSLLVYSPVAHWLFNPSGWLASLGAQDWAGGLVVHASAGAAVIAILLVVGRRRRWPHAATPPHSIPLVVLGAGILWFGWFGFNAGDGLRVDGVAAQALINTQVAGAAAMLLWLLVERIRDGHSTVLGAVTGAVAGLATITPCAGYVSTLSAALIGAIAGLVCQWALGLKKILKLDDALDVIAVHFTGGVIGTLLVGVFAERAINPTSADGLLFGGGVTLLGHQALATVVVVLYSFVLTWVIAMAIEKTVHLKVVDPDTEDNLDQAQQGASAYAFGRAISVMQTQLAESAQVAPPVARPEPAGAMKLVSVLIDDTDADEIKARVIGAGAISITLADASQYTPLPTTEHVRGSTRLLDFVPRIRVQAVVPENLVTPVSTVLGGFAGASEFVEVTDLQLVEHGATSS